MINTLFLYASACCAFLVLNGCCVIFGGSQYYGRIIVKDHPKADIYVDGRKLGRGEAEELFHRRDDLTVEVKEEGCPTKIKSFRGGQFRVSPFVFSIFAMFPIGMLIDIATYACYQPSLDDPSVEKESDKDFTFTVDYSECDHIKKASVPNGQ